MAEGDPLEKKVAAFLVTAGFAGGDAADLQTQIIGYLPELLATNQDIESAIAKAFTVIYNETAVTTP